MEVAINTLLHLKNIGIKYKEIYEGAKNAK